MKKKIIIASVLIIIVVLLIFIVNIFMNKTQETNKSTHFILDSENKYEITTNTKWMTMRNDGGSHTNVYYQIDFNENKVTKCEDEYVGFKGYIYKGKILYSKDISEKEKAELKLIIDSIINNVETKPEGFNYSSYYVLTSFNSDDVEIYNKDVIDDLEELLKK